MKLCVLIPAFRPTESLVDVVAALVDRVEQIFIVNDGSGGEFDRVFDRVRQQPKVTVLQHATNLGKGAALKTGINAFLCLRREDLTLVSADADGQHTPADILKVGEAGANHAESLILGARQFAPDDPVRSRFGNVVTRRVLRIVVGCRLSDTQTGLRAIPNQLMPLLLKLPARGYEFELDMLVLAKQLGVGIREVPVESVYLDGNASSHFDPLRDSMRIYFVLFRFALASLATTALDYSVFSAILLSGAGIASAQAAARLIALVFNYFVVKRLVFYSDQKHTTVFPRYAAVVVVSGLVSYGLIRLITSEFTSVSPLVAKLIAETIVFIANFAVLRDFIFAKREAEDVESRVNS